MMRVPGRKVLRRVMRPVKRNLFPGAVVLGYHRIADVSWDPLGLAVSPRHFAEHLKVLQSLRQIISLGELIDRYANGESLEQYAVLTFDDGYRDFADTVVPVARAHETPVTIFVATGCIGKQFWWEELAALLSPETQGRPILEVRINGSASLRFTGLDDPAVRVRAANEIGARLSSSDSDTATRVIAQLRDWADEDCAVAPDASPMTEAAMMDVARNPAVEVGAHTVSHCFLEGLSEDQQYAEIVGSKNDLERWCGRPIRLFSYPSGSYSRATPGIVRGLGFAGACASMEGTFSRGGDPYLIPRNWVADVPGPAFRTWLGNWIREARG